METYKCENCGKEYKAERFYKLHIEKCATQEETNDTNSFLKAFYKDFNPSNVKASQEDMKRLYDIFEEVHKTKPKGDIQCKRIAHFVVVNLWKYYKRKVR